MAFFFSIEFAACLAISAFFSIASFIRSFFVSSSDSSKEELSLPELEPDLALDELEEESLSTITGC